MATAYYIYITVAWYTVFSLAIEFAAPRATDTTRDRSKTLGYSPTTTTAPSYQDLRRHIKRQLEPRQALTETCGYFSADLSDPFSCDVGSACAYNNEDLYFGCCPYDTNGQFLTSECPNVNNPYTSCVPYTDAAYCTGACFNSNRVCGETYPFCALVLLVADEYVLSAYLCNSVLADAVYTVYTTWTTSARATTSSTARTTTTTRTTSRTTTPITTSTPSTTTSTSVTSSTSLSASTSTSDEDKKRPNNTGAIVGGVIGGIVVLAAIIGAVIFFLRRKKKSERKEARYEISQVAR